MYEEPCKDKPCMNCKHRNYDSFHNETWCGHKPVPEGIGSHLLIDKWGSCEYWEDWEEEK
jgi:hypothetical protein